jgi:mono/diheme cytochrome c family protein
MSLTGTIRVLSAVVLLAAGCSEGGAPESTPAATPAPLKSGAAATSAPAAQQAAPPAGDAQGDLVAEGRSAYLGNCIACHNPDPTQDGALGPAIAGASRPLLEARVLRGEYPEGYTPKRDTKNMIPMPFLEGKIPALAAYLASVGK